MARSRSGFSKPNRVQTFPELQPIETERKISGVRRVVKLFLMGCGLRAAGCGLRAAGCGLWAVGCGLWAVGCGLWAVGCGVRIRSQAGHG